MKILTWAAVVICFCTMRVAEGSEPSALPRSSPEEQGVSSSALLDFIEKADRDIANMHSFMLVRHGQVVAPKW